MPLILYHRQFKFQRETVETAKKSLYIYQPSERNAMKSLNEKNIKELNQSFQLLMNGKDQLTHSIKSNLRAWFQFPSSGSHLRGQTGIGPQPDGKPFIYKSSKYKEPTYTSIIQGMLFVLF